MRLSAIRVSVTFVVSFFIALMMAPAGCCGAVRDLSGAPQRIISLSPAITEGLYLLGLENTVVGVTIYCQKPPRAQKKEKIGSIMEPDMEKIVSLKPDLVLAMSLTGPKEIQKLKTLGLNVVIFQIPRDFSQLCDVFLKLGKIVGKENEAKKLVDESKKRVYDISNRIKPLPKREVLIQIGSKPLFVATRDSFLNDYIELAGGTNIFKDAGSGSVGTEEVVKRNPEIIMIAAMGMSGESERIAWQRFATIRAVREKRIYIVDAYKLCSPTPVSFAGYLEDIVRLLHP